MERCFYYIGEGGEVNIVTIDPGNQYGIPYTPAEVDIQPIHITEDILVRACRCDRNGQDFSLNGMNIHVIENNRFELEGIEIGYLHELQECWFNRHSQDMNIDKNALVRCVQRNILEL